MSENLFNNGNNWSEQDYFPQQHQGRKRIINGDKFPYIDPASVESTDEERQRIARWVAGVKKNLAELPEPEPKPKETSKLTGSQQFRLVMETLRKYDHLHDYKPQPVSNKTIQKPQNPFPNEDEDDEFPF